MRDGLDVIERTDEVFSALLAGKNFFADLSESLVVFKSRVDVPHFSGGIVFEQHFGAFHFHERFGSFFKFTNVFWSHDLSLFFG